MGRKCPSFGEGSLRENFSRSRGLWSGCDLPHLSGTFLTQDSVKVARNLVLLPVGWGVLTMIGRLLLLLVYEFPMTAVTNRHETTQIHHLTVLEVRSLKNGSKWD